MHPRALVMVAFLLPLAGCAAPIDQGPCPAVYRSHVSIRVEGAGAPLQEARFGREHITTLLRMQRTCAGGDPHPIVRGLATDNGASGEVFTRGTFDELRLTFTDRVLRFGAPFDLRSNVSFVLDLTGEKPFLTRDGAPLGIDRFERHAPGGLAPFSQLLTLPMVNATRNITWQVNSSWNQGARVGIQVPDENGVPGPLRVRVWSPRGTLINETLVTGAGAAPDIDLPPLEQGLWRVEVSTQASPRPEGFSAARLEVVFAY